MNDMTPITVRLTADHARSMLEAAGASNVVVVGKGIRFLAFFETGRKRQAWIIRRDAKVHNFAQDVAREFNSN
jgi:hypothetical protein